VTSQYANDEQLHTHGLSGDHGWSDADEVPLRGLRSLLFVAAGALYFGSVWLLSGLAPLPLLLSRLRGDHPEKSDLPMSRLSRSTRGWRETAA
jgi:hypothetical protein